MASIRSTRKVRSSVLDDPRLAFGWVAVEQAQVPERFGGRDGCKPRLRQGRGRLLAPGAIGAQRAKTRLEGVYRQRAVGHQQLAQSVFGRGV